MTSYGIRVKFKDSEMAVLQKAVDHYVHLCRRQSRKGDGAFRSVSIKRLRMMPRADLKYGRGISMDNGQIEAVRRVLRTYVEARQDPGGERVTARERRIIDNICAILERELRRAVINASLAWAARGRLWVPIGANQPK